MTLDNIVGGQGNGLEDLIPVVEDNHDSDKKVSLETATESALNDDRPTEEQNPPVSWTELKRGRKIETTSLLLKRKKERYKHREVLLKQAPKTLRLRGGGGDDDGGMNSEQDERKPDEPSTTTEANIGEEAITEADADKKAMSDADEKATSEEDVDKEGLNKADLGKEAMSETEDEKEVGDVDKANCGAGDDKDAISQAGRASKRTRRKCQKYQDDTWLTEFNETCCDLILTDEDSYDDKTWSPEQKKRKIYGGMDASDDEDEEIPKKKRKVCSQKLPTTLASVSPVIEGMLKKLDICKADHSKKKQALNKLAASLAIHRWARKTNFPLLQQQLLLEHFREIMIDYGRLGAGVLSTSEISLKKCWQQHYCSNDTKVHTECFLCAEETWGDIPKDCDISLEPVLNCEIVLGEERAEDEIEREGDGDLPAQLPSSLDQIQEEDDRRQHIDSSPSVGNDFLDLPLSSNDVADMMSTLRAKETEIEQLKAALVKLRQQDLSEELEINSKSMPTVSQSVTPSTSKEHQGTREQETTELKCTLCEARYKNYSSLVKHCRKKHNMEAKKPEKVVDYECGECGKSYKEKQVLEQHKKNVHNKRICRFCEKPQSNLKRHEQWCEENQKKKKTDRKKKKCSNCNLEVFNLPSHMKICLRKKTNPPPALASSLTHQERFGLPMTIAEQAQEAGRLGTVAALVEEMELVSATIASREGISLRTGIKTFANGQCLLESVSAQLLHRRPQDAHQSEPLVFQSLVDQLINIDGNKREDLEQAIRIKVVDFLCDNDLALDRFVYNRPDLPDDEYVPPAERGQAFQEQLNDLRRGNQYAMSAGDLMIDGVCAALGVNILIMRTDTPDDHPFDLHTPTALGGQLKQESPIFLMFTEARSHFEEARPLDAASEARLLVIQQTFARHGFWPFKYKSGKRIDLLSKDLPTTDRGQIQSSSSEHPQNEPDEDHTNPTPENERSLPSKTPKKRKLYSMKQDQLPQVFSPEEDQDHILVEPTGVNLETGTASQQLEGDKRRQRQDEEFFEILTPKEKENFQDFREQLDEGVRDLPAFQEELKKVRMGDEKIEQMVSEYKEEIDGNDMRGGLHGKKFKQKDTATARLWLAQLKNKVFPFLHTKYRGINLSILVDFKEEMEHTNYHRSEPQQTTKLHKFTLTDMKESVNSSYNSLPNPGASKEQLVMAWQALARAIAWHAKHNKVVFLDRNDAIDTISHYQDAADMLKGAIKICKEQKGNKRAEDQMQGKVQYESSELAQGVQAWYNSDERQRLLEMLDELSQLGKVVTQNQYVQLEELVHTEMIVSSPFRNIVWREFPYRGLAEAWQNPGWDPNFISDRPEESVETITEDGILIKITNDITKPPPSLACEHQSKDPNCTCPNACPPSGHNVLLTWDKGSSQSTKRNRYLHLPKLLYDMMSKFATIRDRYFSVVMKNGPSGEEPENWFMGLCPLLLNSAGKPNSQFSMSMASRIMKMEVSPHMFRKHFCTFLAHHKMEAVRAAQPQVCGHSTSVFQQYYDLNTRKDAQALIQTIQNWHSVGDTPSQTDEQAKECQKRVDMEKQRIQEVNKEVEQQEEPIDTHSFKTPILKTDLALLLKTATRMKLDMITSHPGFDAASRAILGDQRLSKEIWKRQLLKVALQDSPNGQLLREVLLQIFNGRPELTRHKWSLRESMMERQANARKRGKVDEQLKDPLWILLDTIFTSVGSKLKIATKAISSGTNDLATCLCSKLPSSFNCFHCGRPVCDRCSR